MDKKSSEDEKMLSSAFFRKKIAQLRQQVQERDFTLICQFCVGGVIYHDLEMQFLSPTINLAFDGPDFVKFCSDISRYIKLELVEVETDQVPYPVGRLDDVEIRFVHYKTFAEAKQKWEERSKRIRYEKILLMATDCDGMGSTECMEAFDRLPYIYIKGARLFMECVLPRVSKEVLCGRNDGICRFLWQSILRKAYGYCKVFN